MKTTIKHPEVSQPMQAKTNKQAPVNAVLQAYKDKTTQLQSTEEEEMVQGKFEAVQKMALDEEETIQGKLDTVQLKSTEEEELLQRKFVQASTIQLQTNKPNNTGLPNQLKAGIESLGGMAMDHVKVHYNSDKPAQLNAHAYAQGSDIHIASGQEKHLPHEAWHVVQQAKGRVKPTIQMKQGIPINDDINLEHEADVMGAKALQMVGQQNTIFESGTQRKSQKMTNSTKMSSDLSFKSTGKNTVQRKITIGVGSDAETWDKAMDYVNPKWNFDAATKKLYLEWLKDDVTDHAYPDRDGLFNALHHASPSRTEYHFGLNGPIPGAHALGPRMDHINKTHAGTVAEYDWIDIPRRGIPLPAHINAVDHNRLPGAIGTGSNTDYSAVRADAIAHKTSLEANTGVPGIPVFANKSAKYTWYRKAKSTPKTAVNVRPDSNGLNAGTDYSKSALIDMLVQGKNVHMHLTGMQARWKGGHPIMTGADFLTVLNKGVDYGQGKGDVTMRELRFIWRYWNARRLTMANDVGVEQQYSFEGHTLFYYNGKIVPAPWTWEATKTGADF